MNWKFWGRKSAAVESDNGQESEKSAQLVVGIKSGMQFVHTFDLCREENPFADVGAWYEAENGSRYFTFYWSDGGFFTIDREEVIYMYTQEVK